MAHDDVPWSEDVDADMVVMISDEEDEEDDEDEPPDEGAWTNAFAQRGSVLDEQRPDLLRGVAGDGAKSWPHGPA